MASSDTLDATFAALADPTRRAILARLAVGDATVTELATPLRTATAWLADYRDYWDSSYQRLDDLLNDLLNDPRHRGT